MQMQYRTMALAVTCALMSLNSTAFAESAELSPKQAKVLQREVEELSAKLKARDIEAEGFRKQLEALTEMVKANAQSTQKAQEAAQVSAAKADAAAVKADSAAAVVVTAANPAPNTSLLYNNSLTPANVLLGPLQPTMKLINDPNTWLGVYGSIEALVQSTTNAVSGTPLAPAAKQSTRLGQIGSSWMSPDRIGFTGAHALGNTGLNAIFRLEAEYQTPTGNQDTPGVLFNRDTWVGIEGKDFGKLTIGRQNTLGRDAIQFWGSPYGSDFANLGEGGWINQERTQALKEYVGGVTGSRADASVVYKRLDGNLYYAGMYQFGSQQGLNNTDNAGPGGASDPSKFNNGSSQALAVAYNFGDVRLGALYNHSNVNSLSNQSYGLGGNWSVTPEVRLNAGYLRYTADQSFVGQRKDNIVTLGALYAPSNSKLDYIVAYNGIRAQNALIDGNGNTFNPYSDATEAVTDPTGTGALSVGSVDGGRRNSIYGSIRYKYDLQTMFFLGFTHTTTSGGFTYDQLNGTTRSTDIGIGGVYNF